MPTCFGVRLDIWTDFIGYFYIQKSRKMNLQLSNTRLYTLPFKIKITTRTKVYVTGSGAFDANGFWK